jgi:probable phosphoglycerate mutase
MKHLYFCRHGQTHANVANVWSGSSETPLTETGRTQAGQAAKHAKNLGIDHIICSPLGRAHETAVIIAKEIGYPTEKIELNSLFVERHFGKMEGLKFQMDANIDDFVDVETLDSMLERARLALAHIRSLEAETVLVVSHGKFGRALRYLIHPHMPIVDGDPATRFNNAEIVQLI